MNTAFRSILLAAACAAITIPQAGARITRIDIQKAESPTFEGAAFGNTGSYEKLNGRAFGELDPRDPLNRSIVYLDKAPRNAAGMVEYSIDVSIIKPVDMRRGNRTIFYDVTNRGGRRAFDAFHVGASAGNDPVSAKDAGDGFLMKAGYTLVTSGWQGDIVPGGGRVAGHFPVPVEPDGRPVSKLITAEYIVTQLSHTLSLGNEGGRAEARPHPAVVERKNEAKLMRRKGPLAARETIPDSDWSFARCPDGKNPVPSDSHLCYPAGFSTDYVYELVYVARDPVVMGIAFAAVRDLVSFLRYDRTAANPLTRGAAAGEDPARYALGFGRSQSGRFIKDLVNEGFNIDDRKRQVFDGILPLISGSRVTLTNMEFATPGRVPSTVTQHYYRGDQFPFTYATLTDPVTGRRGGWLERCSGAGRLPQGVSHGFGHRSLGRPQLAGRHRCGRQNRPAGPRQRAALLLCRHAARTFRPRRALTALQKPLQPEPLPRRTPRASGCDAGLGRKRRRTAAVAVPEGVRRHAGQAVGARLSEHSRRTGVQPARGSLRQEFRRAAAGIRPR